MAREVQAKFDTGRAHSKMTDTPDMYQIAARVLTEYTDDTYDADALMATEPIDEVGDPRDRKARYELRYKEIRISEGGTVGKLSIRLFEGTFRMQLAEAWKALQDEQPAATWAPVAGEVISRYLGKSQATVTKQDDSDALRTLYASSLALLQNEKAQAIGQSKTFVEMADTQLVARIAFADLSRSEVADPVGSHHEGKADVGSFAQYARTKNLRHLGVGGHRQRKLAGEVIMAYYADRPRDVVEGAERKVVPIPDELKRVSFTFEQLEAGEQARQQNVKWADVAKLMGSDDERKARAAVLKHIEGKQQHVTGRVTLPNESAPAILDRPTGPSDLAELRREDLEPDSNTMVRRHLAENAKSP